MPIKVQKFITITKLVKIFSRTASINDVKKTSNKLTVSVNISNVESNKIYFTCEYAIIVKKAKVYKMKNTNNKTKYTIDDVMNAVMGVSNRLAILEGEFHQFREDTNKRLDKIEKRLDNIEDRLDKVEQRLDNLEKRVDKIEQRLDKVEQRLDIHEKALKKGGLL